jgi:hypothetical protein
VGKTGWSRGMKGRGGEMVWSGPEGQLNGGGVKSLIPPGFAVGGALRFHEQLCPIGMQPWRILALIRSERV